MKTIMVVLFLLLITPAFAHGEDDFAQAGELIKQQVPCDELTEEQLELIGDYYMEQMHPGEAHERMDEMMGGEGSAQLRQIHINMARSFYCGEHQYVTSGMMNTMMGRGGMMNMMYGTGSGMMGWGWMGIWWLLWIIIAAFIFAAAFWIMYKVIIGNGKRK